MTFVRGAWPGLGQNIALRHMQRGPQGNTDVVSTPGTKLCGELATVKQARVGWQSCKSWLFFSRRCGLGEAESEIVASTVNNDFCHRSPSELPPAKLTYFFICRPLESGGRSLAFGFPAPGSCILGRDSLSTSHYRSAVVAKLCRLIKLLNSLERENCQLA